MMRAEGTGCVMLDGWLKAGITREGAGSKAPEPPSHWAAIGNHGRKAQARLARTYLPELRTAALRFAKPLLFGAALLLACATALLLLPGRGGADAPDDRKAATPATPGGPEKPAWLPVVRPIRLFALEAPELIKAVASYDAIRSTAGDGREDSLSFGAAARLDALFMRLSVYRAGSEAADPAPFFVDLTRRVATAGLAVSKATQGEPIRTKFGDMEIAEMKLSMKGVERSCLAFRRAVPGESLRLGGWYCTPAGAFGGRAGLSCLIDRLALISAGEDNALRDGFVAAERRRLACGKSPMLAASVASAASAQDPNPPRLRGLKPR
jgi:hypothetical protein